MSQSKKLVELAEVTERLKRTREALERAERLVFEQRQEGTILYTSIFPGIYRDDLQDLRVFHPFPGGVLMYGIVYCLFHVTAVLSSCNGCILSCNDSILSCIWRFRPLT